MKNASEMKHITYLFDHAEDGGDAAQHEGYTRNGNAVAQCLIAGTIRSGCDVRPAIREALQPLTLQWGQSADETLPHGIRLTDEVGGILVLPHALGAGHVLLHKLVD